MTRTGTSLKPVSIRLLRLSRKFAAIGAKALGMLVVSAIISITATLLFARLLPAVIDPSEGCGCFAHASR